MSSYNKSSYFYDSSPIVGTSNQIIWAGGDVYCTDVNGVDVLVACNGTRLTTMQINILNRICALEGVTDMTRINLPCSLYQAWVGQDETILNYIQFLLDNACLQKQVVDSLPTTNDPSVAIEYCCCANVDGCGTTVNVALSVHIQNIITCLCEYKEEVASTYATITKLTLAEEKITTLENEVCILNANQVKMGITLNCLINAVTSLGGSTCTYTPSITC